MTQARDPDEIREDEQRLLAALRQSIPLDAPPRGLVQRAEGLISMMDFDADLAELLETSAPELVGMRGGATLADVLRFEVSEGSISLEVTLERDDIAGTILAGDIDAVVLEGPHGDLHSSDVDAIGRFEFPPTGARLVRLRLLSSSARPVATDWFLR